MRKQTLVAIITAAMLVLAGCAGSSGGDTSPTETTVTPDDTTTDDTGDDDGGTGTVEFYVSDDPGQIDDFRHLNVTITEIGFERAGNGGEDESDDETEDIDDDTEDETVDETDDDTENETAETTQSTENDTTADGADAADGEDAEETESEDETESEGEEDGETEETEEEGDEESEGEDDEERGGWVTHDVDSRTVDLTELRGDNATLIDSPQIPAGNYSKVFVHVSDINATLTDGTSVNVKLPSEKLQLNKGFTLEQNGTVSFVYDITVFKTGNSGKYILKPVISESGTDQNIEDVDDREGDEEDEDTDDEDTEETEADEREQADEEDSGGPPDENGEN